MPTTSQTKILFTTPNTAPYRNFNHQMHCHTIENTCIVPSTDPQCARVRLQLTRSHPPHPVIREAPIHSCSQQTTQRPMCNKCAVLVRWLGEGGWEWYSNLLAVLNLICSSRIFPPFFARYDRSITAQFSNELPHLAPRGLVIWIAAPPLSQRRIALAVFEHGAHIFMAVDTPFQYINSSNYRVGGFSPCGRLSAVQNQNKDRRCGWQHCLDYFCHHLLGWFCCRETCAGTLFFYSPMLS